MEHIVWYIILAVIWTILVAGLFLMAGYRSAKSEYDDFSEALEKKYREDMDSWTEHRNILRDSLRTERICTEDWRSRYAQEKARADMAFSLLRRIYKEGDRTTDEFFVHQKKIYRVTRITVHEDFESVGYLELEAADTGTSLENQINKKENNHD